MISVTELDECLAKVCEKFLQTFSFNYFLIDNLYRTGIRFSELDVSKWTIIDSNFVKLESTKNSNERIFDKSELNEVFFDTILRKNNKCKSVNYTTLISQLKRCFYPNFLVCNEKMLIAHSFRHNYIKKLFESTKNIYEVKQRIGHKSINNTLSYITSNIEIK